jgi:hypothetical protein
MRRLTIAISIVTLMACGSKSEDSKSKSDSVSATAGSHAAESAPATAMATDVCRKADMFIDGCHVGGWNNMADDNYQCKSLKDKCRSECILSNAHNCEEFGSGVGVGGTELAPISKCLEVCN